MSDEPESRALGAAQDDLRRSQLLLRGIFDGASDAMLLSDDEGRYVDANPAACELFGLARDELLGCSVHDFAPPGHDGPGAYRELLGAGRVRGQFPLLRRDGQIRMLDFSAVSSVAPGLHLSVLRDVTDRLAAEEALRRSEALFRAVVQKSGEAVSLTFADGTTRYLTPQISRLFGWSPEEMATRVMRDQVLPEDQPRIAAALEDLVRTGRREMTLEFRVRHEDGSILWVESTGTNMLDDPDVAAIVGNYRDVTARKRAEDEMRASRDLLEETQAIAHVGSWSSSLDGGSLTSSRECSRIFGLDEGTEPTAEAYLQRVHPDDRQRVLHSIHGSVESGAPYDLEHRVVHPDGRVRWVHGRAVLEHDARGAPSFITGSVQDVTDRRLAVEALQASEERYRRIVENTSEGVWMYDPEGVTTFMNRRMAEMLGYPVEELVGRRAEMVMSDADRLRVPARIARRRRGIAERTEGVLQRKDGTPLWVSIQSNPLFGAAGGFEAVLMLVRDVSAEHIAGDARARHAALTESSDDAIVGATLDGSITSWNPAAEHLYQSTAAEMLGRSILCLWDPATSAEEAWLLEGVRLGQAVRNHETAHRRRDGTAVAVALTLSPVRDATGAVGSASFIMRDLTAQRRTEDALRRTEEQFRHAQKMEAVGRLAGGVAHDFNNLLSVILGYAGLALEDTRDADPLREHLDAIVVAGGRATELTRQLLAFSRQQVLHPRVIDLGAIVAGMVSMLRRLLGEDIQLETRASPEPCRVLADPGQIEQVVMNLAVNARDAMKGGGALRIETRNVSVAAGHPGADGVVPGDHVVLAVTDEGEGMDAATRARIFEPFFTTKAPGQGTGLGLATVFGIVQQSGGQVIVDSERGRGTTFLVYLPRTDLPFEQPPHDGPRGVIRGTETILLVEDEAPVRAVASAILRRHGYRVLATSGAEEARQQPSSFEGKIDLLLTDVVMPVTNGRQLAEELASSRPRMKVLFASGYTDDAILHRGVSRSGVSFLQKPFTPEMLLSKVREVIDAPAS